MDIKEIKEEEAPPNIGERVISSEASRSGLRTLLPNRKGKERVKLSKFDDK